MNRALLATLLALAGCTTLPPEQQEYPNASRNDLKVCEYQAASVVPAWQVPIVGAFTAAAYEDDRLKEFHRCMADRGQHKVPTSTTERKPQ